MSTAAMFTSNMFTGASDSLDPGNFILIARKNAYDSSRLTGSHVLLPFTGKMRIVENLRRQL